MAAPNSSFRSAEAPPATEPATALAVAQRLVEICQGRQATDRQYYRSKQREARVAFPHDQAQRDEYCAPARAAVLLAITNTTRAKEQLAALEAGEAPAAAEPEGAASTDWIPDYPSSADDPEGYDYDSRDDDDHREDDEHHVRTDAPCTSPSTTTTARTTSPATTTRTAPSTPSTPATSSATTCKPRQ